jgi:threonylcarbamoyladenosine tRNA methylthiotransferase MtaB
MAPAMDALPPLLDAPVDLDAPLEPPRDERAGGGARLVTFGCRLNAYETEVMRGLAEQAKDPSLVVVNTCAVTAEAVRQAKQHIRKISREDPQARIVVTGCAAQIEPETFAGLPGVARVLGNMEKLEARNFRLDDGANTTVRVNDIMSVRETAGHLLDGFAERARAFIEVQQGCDHRCTFCIIPFGRGNSRSVPAGLVVERVKRLVGAGFNEVVLTGVDITSWGGDLPGTPTLGNLVQRILKLVPDLPRLRLSSLDMIEMDPALFDALADPRLMPHLHLSLQHGDDMILKRMKRRHSRDQAIAFVDAARARRPDLVFGADLIAGFPTEDDAMFANLLSIVDACDLTYLHVFPYSERAGTPAARMPQVPKPVRKARAAALRAKGTERQAAFLASQVGRIISVLVEKDSGAGHSEHYAPVLVRGGAVPGAIVQARVTSVAGDALLAQPVEG